MYVDESRFPAITVYLAVNGGQGKVLAGLQQEDFTLRETASPWTSPILLAPWWGPAAPCW